MTIAQALSYMPIILGGLAWLVSLYGSIWDVLHHLAFTAIAVILALQHRMLLTGLVRGVLGIRDPGALPPAIVTAASMVIIYITLWGLYRVLWQPALTRSSTSNGLLKLFYSLIGAGIGWTFGALVVFGLLNGGVIRPYDFSSPEYSRVVQNTALTVIGYAEFFHPPY